MITVESLPAGHGDALVIEYGDENDIRAILVDAGPRHSWPDVKGRLLEMEDRPYETFVVTHVDEDHIGGATLLLADDEISNRVSTVWFNGFTHIDQGSNVLGPVDGERLTKLIVDNGLSWNEAFADLSGSGSGGGPAVVASEGDLPKIELDGGAELYLLSPSGPKLERMRKVWAKEVEKAGLVPGKGTDLKAPKLTPSAKLAKPIAEKLDHAALEAMAKKTTPDGSEANGSSIALMFCHGDKRVLLGADAHPDLLTSSLIRFGQMMGEEKPRIDLFKLPHHGSKANVTAQLLAAADVDNYLISTNGDTFGHPDNEAMARLLIATDKRRNIYCNYASPQTKQWVAPAKKFGAKIVLAKSKSGGIRVTC